MNDSRNSAVKVNPDELGWNEMLVIILLSCNGEGMLRVLVMKTILVADDEDHENYGTEICNNGGGAADIGDYDGNDVASDHDGVVSDVSGDGYEQLVVMVIME